MNEREKFIVDFAFRKIDQTISMLQAFDTKTSILLTAYGVAVASLTTVANGIQTWKSHAIGLTILVAILLIIGGFFAFAILRNSNPDSLPNLNRILENRENPQLVDNILSQIGDSCEENEERIIGHESAFMKSVVFLSAAFIGILILIGFK